MAHAGAALGADEWECSVATYCVSLGLQMGFQSFTPSKAASWHPSTIFIATHSLTNVLRDVASRLSTQAAPGTPPQIAVLACAVRQLHGTIFQPYVTWLRAVKLGSHSGRSSRPPPDADSLHLELADLALYWLIYSEAANLRHAPEALWFIFYCARRSWQVKQVLAHLRLHREALAALPHQTWLAELGPGLPRALRELHRRHRGGAAGCDVDRSCTGLLGEATLKPPAVEDARGVSGEVATAADSVAPSRVPSSVLDASALGMYGDAAAAAVAGGCGADGGRAAVRITVLANGSVSMPYNPTGKDFGGDRHSVCGQPAGAAGRDTDARRDDGPASTGGGAVEGSSGGGGAPARGRRMGPPPLLFPDYSPLLPLPPTTAASSPATTATWSTSSTVAAPSAPLPSMPSAFASPAAAAAAAASNTAHTPALPRPRHGNFASVASTPTAPKWEPHTPPRDYRELLQRLCPNEDAIAAALRPCGGAGGGDGSVFLTRVVQPLFLFLSEQVFELGQARRQGLESAVRIAYDDVSESLAHPAVVAAALAALPWATASTVTAGGNKGNSGGGSGVPQAQPHPHAGHQPHTQQQQQQQAEHVRQAQQQVMPRAAAHDEELYWSRLLALSDLPSVGSARIPWRNDMAHYRPQLLRLLHGGDGSAGGNRGGSAVRAGADQAAGRGRGSAQGGAHRRSSTGGGGGVADLEAPALTSEQAAQAASAANALAPEAVAELGRFRAANAAADWWARRVLRKTFEEHRSLAMPLIAFSRVYQFQLVWFYIIAAWSWSNADDTMRWIASAAALHWGSNCLLWTMQAVMAAGVSMKRSGVVVPFHTSADGKAKRGPTAPPSTHNLLWWTVQLAILVIAWVLLLAGVYGAFIVWPAQPLFGHQCYDLFWGRSCYWWIAVVYGALVILYELLYRQLNLGGYARAQLHDLLLRVVPGADISAAATSASPLYSPSAHLRTSLQHLLGNALLWAATLGLKFVLDYYVLIKPAGPRLGEILATNKLAWTLSLPESWGWWPEGWDHDLEISLDALMAAALVLVLFLLSLVCAGVAYSVLGAVLGALSGVRQGVGSIRHWSHIRAGFHSVQASMRAKLLSPEEFKAPDSRSWALRAAGSSMRAAGRLVCLPLASVAALLRWARCLPPLQDGRPKSWEQREETLSVTAPFWNAIVKSLRGRDLLNDKEAAALSFEAVSLSPAAMMATWRRGASGGVQDTAGREKMSGEQGPRETYLPPVAVYVAQIPHMVIGSSAPTAEQAEVLQESYLYLLHLLVAVGAIPRSAPAPFPPPRSPPTFAGGGATPADGAATPTSSAPSTPDAAAVLAAAAAAAAADCPDLHKDSFHPERFAHMPLRASSHQRLVARRELLGSVVGLVRMLLEAAKTYKDTAAALQHSGRDSVGGASAASTPVAAAAAATAARARTIDKLCMALHAVARCMTQMKDLPWSVAVIANRVVVRQHYHQPAVKAQLDRGFAGLVATVRNNATAWGAQHLPSLEDFSKVSSWLLAILRPSDEGTAPANPEAVALLADFCSGLGHPSLPTAPRVEAMRSVSTLIPHYQETVMYALSTADARRVLEAAGATGLEGSLADDEVLFKNDDGAPSELLQYLVSEFPDEFRNLLERCRSLVPLAKGEPAYVLEDFLPFGRLHTHRAQLLLWASFRGQVLARTVDGMSMYRIALAMQAVQDAMGVSSAATARSKRHSGQQQQQQQQRQQQQQQQRAAGAAGAGAGDWRLRLTGVQRMLVRGILRDPSLCVEELVAQMVDVVPGLGELLDRKYSLVVSSQVFSTMAASRSVADRWRAHGIALLATRYSALRVAYLEQGEPLTLFKAPDFTYRVGHQTSVLVRAVSLEQEVAARKRAREDREAAAAAGGCGAGSVADGMSEFGDGDSEEDLEGDGGDDDDAGAALRLWRRRHQLRNLAAAELEVLFRQQQPVNYLDTSAAGVGVILGEGKPENQNSAIPYCAGVLLQTIDMNQDNSLAQAFKLRNATREFEPLGRGPQQQQLAVLGYPEWIFSYRCGLLADLAAATERTFGTQLQRVMCFPSAVRSHYGHPDLWNRLFSMTRGGVSKANAAQHVSEDVFGGYNALKRGGLSRYVSYISVGKGRDMGLDSILGFEGKISKGAAEQLMSRDVRFLGGHFDFFRCMSFYHTGPGHFINTWLTVCTIRLGVWVQLLLLLGGVGATGGGSMAAAMGAVQILQLGTLPIIGYLFNLWLESGLASAMATLARQFIGGGLLFHIFRSTTSAFHLGRAVLFGGASYVATGRGFSLRRKTFTQVYVNYGRSHLYMGADILIMVILILVAGNNGANALPVPAASCWSPILVAAALLAGPYWFTPFFFRLGQVLRDTREFRAWVAGSGARGVPEGWAEWNASQLAPLRNDARAQVPRYRFWSVACIVLPRIVIASLSGIVAVTGAHFATPKVPDLLWVLGGSVAAWLLLALWSLTRRAYLSSGLGVSWRWAKGLVQVLVMGMVVLVLVVCLFTNKKGLRLSGVLITFYANYQIAGLLVTLCVVCFPKTMAARSLANAAYRQADAALGTALAAVLIVICFIGEIGLVMVDKVQTLVQFNDRYSHSAAARPYAGDDDPAAAAAGGGGGGGMVAAAAALRRRGTPSVMLALPPHSTGGAAPKQSLASGPPSVIGGWVSPRFRTGGGTTPVLMYGSTNVGHVAAAALAAGNSVGVSGGCSTPTAASAAAPAPPAPPAAPAHAPQRAPVPPANMAPDWGRMTLRRTTTAPVHWGAVGRSDGAAAAPAAPAPASGSVAAAVTVHQAQNLGPKELTWGPAPTIQRAVRPSSSSRGGAVPPVAESTALVSSRPAAATATATAAPTTAVAAPAPPALTSSNAAGGMTLPPPAWRLPRAEEWHPVAVAAAEVGAAATAAAASSAASSAAPLAPQPTAEGIAVATDSGRSVGSRQASRYPQVMAWGSPMPPAVLGTAAAASATAATASLAPSNASTTSSSGAVRRSGDAGLEAWTSAASSRASAAAAPATAAAAAAAPGGGEAPPVPWAARVSPPSPTRSASPMRAHRQPRPLSASPALPPIRPSSRPRSALPAVAGSNAAFEVPPLRGADVVLERLRGAFEGTVGARAGSRSSSGGGSFEAPPAVQEGALSTWMEPRAMAYAADAPAAPAAGAGGLVQPARPHGAERGNDAV